jgi:putative ABC transport system permease protein
MAKCLRNFDYRTNIDCWVFAGSGGIAMLIALFTVSFQSIKASMTNPVKSLGSE